MLKSRIDAKAGLARVSVRGGVRRESVMMAAHVLAGKAEVWLSGAAVELRPRKKGGGRAALEALAAEFSEEVLCQELRRRIAAANRSVREYIVTQAMLAALGEQQSTPAPQMGNLSAEQEGDIERLILEAEAELSEPDAPAAGDGPPGPSKVLEPRDAGRP